MTSIRKLPILGLAAAAAFALTPSLLAQTTSRGYGSTGARENTTESTGTTSDMNKTSGMGTNLSSADKTFAKKAAMDGIAEVELGRLAADKASSEQVKDFAKQMVDDHSKVNDQLKTLAASKGIDLPTDTDKRHKAKMSKLENLSGAAFDKAYVKEQMKDHVAAIKLFRKEANKGKDADLKSFAEKTVPTLEHHQQHVDQVASTIGVRGKRTGTLPAAGTTSRDMKSHEKSGTSSQGGGSSNPNPNP